jgi:hypothetical protein
LSLQTALSRLAAVRLPRRPLLPSDLHLWLINHGTENGIAAFWPHTEAIPTDKKWEVKYDPREFQNLASRRLQMFVVSEEGQKLFNYFKQANQYHTKGAAVHWPGILQRPSDMVAVSSEIKIKLLITPKSEPS